MTDQDNSPAITQRMSDYLRSKLQSALPNALYNPYKLWTLGKLDSDDRQRIRVLQIKVSDTQSLVACPEKHLVSTGTDFLETLREFQSQLLNTMGLPRGTLVTVTCTSPFDLDGNPIARKAINRASAEPANPPATTATDEPSTTGTGLFDAVEDNVDFLDDEPDPNQELQGSLFL